MPALAGAHRLPAAPRCPVFPAENPWNQRVDRLPVARDSARLIASIGLSAPVHPDFGSGLYDGEPIGIPYAVVSNRTRRVRVSFDYASESDKGRYPIPPNVPIEGGPHSTGDRHVIVVNRDTCIDYELYDAHPLGGGRSWHAGSGAIFNLRSNHLRPGGLDLGRRRRPADPARPGALRRGQARLDRSRAALHRPVHGGPLRVSGPPRGVDVQRLLSAHGIARAAEGEREHRGPSRTRPASWRVALKRYGMILADNGSPWFISGAPSPGWNNDALHLLDRLHGSDFEVVDTSSLPHPGK